MKIQITKGVYGHTENGIVTPKTKDSEPFEVDDKKAKELISAGVAKKASELKSEADTPIRYRESLAPKNNTKEKTLEQSETNNSDTVNPDKGDDEDNGGDENAPEYSLKNTKDELLKIAADMGIVIEKPDNTTKQQIIDLLDEATAGDAPQIGDNAGIVE